MAATKGIILIHGSWHGGWCWNDVASRLRSQGHVVVARSLLGCSDRSATLRPELTVEQMVDDVVDWLRQAGLQECILVAHSSGGLIAQGVAGRLRERVSHLILLDAIVVASGEVGFSVYPPADQLARKAAAIMSPAGALVPVPAPLPTVWGIDGANFEWAKQRLSPHPLAAFTTPVPSSDGLSPKTAVTYVSCNAPEHPILASSKKRARLFPDIEWIDLDEPHDCMITNPGRVATIIQEPPK